MLYGKSKYKVGDVFGQLTLVVMTDRRQGESVIWKSQCTCGRFCFTSTELLRRTKYFCCPLCKSIQRKRRNKEDAQNF